MANKDDLARAIDVMTAWSDEPNGGDFAWQRMVERATDEPNGDIKLVIGLVTLAGWLLVRLEEATKKDIRTHLQEIALMND